MQNQENVNGDTDNYTKQDYRNALDALELAITELGIADLVQGWAEPRYTPTVRVKLSTTAGTVYRLYDAYARANDIMNNPGEASTIDPLDEYAAIEAEAYQQFRATWGRATSQEIKPSDHLEYWIWKVSKEKYSGGAA